MNLNIRSCYNRRLHERVCLRGTALLGMPDMDIHFLGLPSLHCVGCFRGALCLFCGHSLLLAYGLFVVHHVCFYRALRACLNLGHRIVFNVNEWAG
jgi:hypothetical protein